jgi:hypothetical protein
MSLRRLSLVPALALAVVLPAVTLAALPPGARDTVAQTPSTQTRPVATPAERAALIRRFVMKWGGYAERVYGVDVRTWSLRMVPTFARGDADNLREALRRDTFEGALATLSGRGDRIADARIIDAFAQVPAGTSAQRTPGVAKALGDLGQDVVFTPITPCRIVDTRIAGGPIAAGQTRSFNAAGQSSYGGQGGAAGNCGMQTEMPTAVALNVTVVAPAGGGFATVFPYNTTRPDTASVNYTSGAIVNNAIIARIPNPPASFDFSIYSFAASDYVVDIVGYFAPPRATALQCLDTVYSSITINAGATGQATAPACPTGYTTVHLDCESSSWSMPIVYSTQKGGGLCGARNGGTGSATLSAARRCCRVPGR